MLISRQAVGGRWRGRDPERYPPQRIFAWRVVPKSLVEYELMDVMQGEEWSVGNYDSMADQKSCCRTGTGRKSEVDQAQRGENWRKSCSPQEPFNSATLKKSSELHQRDIYAQPMKSMSERSILCFILYNMAFLIR